MVTPIGFAQQLRSLRHAQGLSVRDFAERVGVSKVTIWKWEKGEVQPRSRAIASIAKALCITPEELHGSANRLDTALSAGDSLVAMSKAPHGEGLAEVVAKAKKMLSEASGVSAQSITISIEY